MRKNTRKEEIIIFYSYMDDDGQFQDNRDNPIHTYASVSGSSRRVMSGNEEIVAELEFDIEADIPVKVGFIIQYEDEDLVVKKIIPIKNKLTGSLIRKLVIV